VGARVQTEVCSLYIYDPRARRLTLWATEGLNKGSVGKVHMGLDEGLTGLVLQKLEPVMVVDALAHPRYKYFPETGEERYHSFLGVPVMVKRKPLGVLVVQTLRRRRFGADEVRLLRTIATQVSSIVVQARQAETIELKEKERKEYRKGMLEAILRLQEYEKQRDVETPPRPDSRSRRLVGVGASPGFGTGRAHVLRPLVSFDDLEQLRSDDPHAEWQRIEHAVSESIDQVEHLKGRLSERMPEVDSSIFDTHRMMLEDRTFLDRLKKLIDDGLAAESALQVTITEYVGTFSRMTQRYLRERATDVKDIGNRILKNLLGVEDHARDFQDDAVLVAEELTLSDLATIDHDKLRGIALATGGVTSHASILAKSFEIPTVVGIQHLLESVKENEAMVVDGNSGIVYVAPSEEIVREYERLDRDYRAFNLELESLHDLLAVSPDGHSISVLANIGLIGDVAFAKRHGAEGVGLYRTEFPFLTYGEFPDEDEQIRLYRKVIEEMSNTPVTIRTLDLGADKYPSYLPFAKEENPFLGWRSIRVSLELTDLFKVQLRAILRASAYGRVKLLLPMISSLEEVWQAKEIIDEAKRELRREGQPFDESVPVGIMIEVPAAVAIADALIREVDFFSLGTNDLIQYVLAVDRNNRKVAPLYEALHPAVIRAVAQAIRAARDQGKWVGICGEMASDPLCVPILIGFGINELSMEPFSIPLIKKLIRSIDFATAQEMSAAVLGMTSVKEIKGYLFTMMKKMGVIELTEIYH
jgi:phosphotransferase system enzyme I (PtsP)